MLRSTVIAAAGAVLLRAAPVAAADGASDAHLMPYIESSGAASTIGGSAGPALFSLNVPIYHSLPAAPARVYLDFDGDFTQTWGSYSPGATPAYDTDGDASTFSQAELDNIHEIWARVSEFYSPFNLDVTTEDPGTLNDLQSMRVVIGGDGKNGGATYWPGARAGGIGYVGGFYNFNPNTVFVFPGNLANGTPKYTAEAAAHESGHGFGLQHQSSYDANGNKTLEYSTGVPGVKAPFMGRPYEGARALWWYGTSISASFYQDDLAILSSYLNGFGYRADDHGDSPASATPLSIVGGAFVADGVITEISDADFFSFSLIDTSHLDLLLTGSPHGGMLDPSLYLFDANGTMLGQSATSSLSESLSLDLPAGLYSIGVLSAGNYGDIGQFVLSGTVAIIPEPGMLIVVASACLTLRRPRVRLPADRW